MSDLVIRGGNEQSWAEPGPTADVVDVPGVLSGELQYQTGEPVFRPPYWNGARVAEALGGGKRSALACGLMATYLMPVLADTNKEAVQGVATGLTFIALSGILHLIQLRRKR